MIVSEGFSWLHANGEWVEYFEIDSLAKRLNLDYATVWNYVQKGMRSDEQLPKQLTGKTKSKAKGKKQETDEYASKHNPIIKTVKKHFAPNEIQSDGMTKEAYLQKLKDEQKRYSPDWWDSNQESAWQLIGKE